MICFFLSFLKFRNFFCNPFLSKKKQTYFERGLSPQYTDTYTRTHNNNWKIKKLGRRLLYKNVHTHIHTHTRTRTTDLNIHFLKIRKL